MEYIKENWIEILGVLFALLYVFYEIKEKAFMWVVALFSSSFYMVIFFNAKFYADMVMSGYYFLAAAYGIYKWTRKIDNRKEVVIRGLQTKEGIAYLGALVALNFLIYYVLSRHTDSPIPFGDAFTSALSIVGTYMLIYKILEVWWVWVVVNLVSTSLYFYKGLELTPYLYIIYTILSVVGYFVWKRKFQNTMQHD